MLYIEDFLELIEPFPQEIRERLTEMRETDLQIQNETDKLDERIKSFFQQCKKQKADWKNQNYEEIRNEYSKLLENAEDKVQITNQLYELIEKYLKKLDQELQKFKLELEADHAGITSKLEEVINNSTINNELTSPTIGTNSCGYMMNSSYNFNDQQSDFTLNTSTTNELMKMMAHNTNNLETNIKSIPSGNQKRKNLDKTKQEDDESNSSWNSKLENSYLSSNPKNPTFHFSDSNKKSSLISSANKKNIKIGQSSANASLNKLIRSNTTISQIQSSLAGSATKQKTPAGVKQQQQPGKQMKSEKSQRIKKTKLIDLDYDDESKYDYFDQQNKHENMLDPDLYTDDLNEETSETTGTSENDLAQIGRLLNNEDEFETDSSGDDMDPGNENEDTTNSDLDNRLKHKRQQQLNRFKEDWNSGEDTNERYCICKDISYGDMIMCDNARCETQWFHFVCVGLNAAPKGKWFCPFCVDSKKKKKEKQLNMILSSNSLTSPSLPTTTVNKVQSNAVDFQQSNTNPFLSASSSFTTSFK